MTKSVAIKDFITQQQFDQAYKLWKAASPGTFARRCADEIITPNLAEINRKLGQENDPKYIAYLLEYAFMQANG